MLTSALIFASSPLVIIMKIDRTTIGNNFYNMVMDIAENYTLTKNDGTEWNGKISIVAKTASTYMLAEREYLMNGVATFPDIQSQRTFRGCYFTREANPNFTYILVSTVPKDTTPLVAEVYAIGCNTTVSLATPKKVKDEKHNTIIVPDVYAEDVKVYADSTLQKQRRSSDGNFDQTLYYMQIPAKYGVTQDDIVLKKIPRYNETIQEHEWIETRFRVEAVDTSMSDYDVDGNIYGILDVQMTIDTRG